VIVSTSRLDWAIFLALGFMWGSSYLFIKIAVAELGTFTLVALRLAIGAALLWAVLAVARKELPRSRRMYGHLVVMGALNIAIPFALITFAEKSVDSALAAILTAIAPLAAGILAPIFIPEEPLRANAVVGLAVGFAGVIALTGGGGGSSTDLASAVALVAASFCYGAGAVYARRNVHGLDPMIPAAFQVTFAFAMTAAIAVALERPWDVRPGTATVFSIVWLGLLGSGLAYLAVFRLLKRWGATRTTAVAYLIPVFGIALGSLVLGEEIGTRTVLGTALILIGIGLVNGRIGRRVLFARGRPDAAGTSAVTPAK
jgi:drug/metabolite transporter (DMT)-like permease